MKSNIRSSPGKQNFSYNSIHNSSLKKMPLKLSVLSLSFLLGLSFFCVPADPTLQAQEHNEQSYLFLFDTSYSMGLRLPGQEKTQWQCAAEGLSSFLDTAEENYKTRGLPPPEYALAEFSDTGSFEVKVPFTTSRVPIESAIQNCEFWEATDIQDALQRAGRYINSGGESEGKKETAIILMSDGIETRGRLYSLPEFSEQGDFNIPVEYIHVPLAFNPLVEERVRYRGKTPSFSYKREVVEYRASSSILLPRKKQTRFPLRFPLLGTHMGWVLLGLLILFFLMKPASSSVFSKKRALQKRGTEGGQKKDRRQKDRGENDLGPQTNVGPPSPRYVVRYLEYKGKEKKSEKHLEFRGSEKEIPLTITAHGFAPPGTAGGDALITFESDGCFINSDKPLLINGVAVRRRRFKPGITIKFASTHYELISIEGLSPSVSEKAKVKKKRKRSRRVEKSAFMRRVAPFWVAGFLFLSALFIFTSGINEPGTLRGTKRYNATAHVRFMPYDWKREFLSPPRETQLSTDGRVKNGRAQKKSVKVIEGIWDGNDWSFPELSPEGKIDYLCFHAHPDDEALDFGGLLAKAGQRGERTAVVLFTDGESGLSRGPENVHGRNTNVLKSTRVEEAKKSLKILGSDFYIRLGFQNHPYSSQTQVLPIEKVYEDWGGYGRVEAAVCALIKRVKPRVVVSPDGPSEAKEHFEHEAVGEVVSNAVDKLSREDPDPLPLVHMKLIDPMQQDVYGTMSRINVITPAWPDAQSPRSVQNLALKEHKSQIDARIVGLEYTPLFESEYYQVMEYDE